ncbi:unnamed protein product [Anisakis simplex]|uniref:Uncharacterized protein n=1 Tax=Anisakis simplex TaxID=6269 RepID=A0A3P6NAQ6_ANISI|nr:unnamed protein product [Anisakis simplex]
MCEMHKLVLNGEQRSVEDHSHSSGTLSSIFSSGIHVVISRYSTMEKLFANSSIERTIQCTITGYLLLLALSS